MQLVLSGDTPQELKTELLSALEMLGYNPSQLTLPGVAETPNKKVKTKKSTEVRGEILSSPLDLTNSDTSEGPVSGTPALKETLDSVKKLNEATKEKALEALQLLNGKKGLPTARALLEKYKAVRFSELKESDYPVFIEDALLLANDVAKTN